MTSAPRSSALPLLVGARHAVPILRISRGRIRPPLEDLLGDPRHKLTPTASLTPLEATLTPFAAAVANKGLRGMVSSLDAMLREYAGVSLES